MVKPKSSTINASKSAFTKASLLSIKLFPLPNTFCLPPFLIVSGSLELSIL